MIDKKIIKNVCNFIIDTMEDFKLNEDNKTFIIDTVPTIVNLLMKKEELIAIQNVLDILINTTNLKKDDGKIDFQLLANQYYYAFELVNEIKEIVEKNYYNLDKYHGGC